MSNYSKHELTEMGITVGENVAIDESVRFFGPSAITIGSHVRIDCQVVISARQPVSIGNHVHLGVAVQLFGACGITIEDFCGISPRASVFSATDDFVGGYLTGPTVPEQFRNVTEAAVVLRKHSLVGCGSVILPGVMLGEGSSVGALSIVTQDLPAYAIAFGVNRISARTRDAELLGRLERELGSIEKGS
jgi:dTDP-4-amino-4,6-dideoxy-D-glucose acyltransferase